jgi:hypothetical protein
VKYPLGGPLHRLHSPSDAEILDARVSKSNTSRGFIQLWGNLAHVSLMADQRTITRKGRRLRLGSIEKNRRTHLLKLPCTLDFRSEDLSSIFCVKIANFLLEDDPKTHDDDHDLDRPRAHYIVLERVGHLSLRRHPLDQGTFRRIGAGFRKIEEADAFFKSVPRRFFTII